MLRLLASSIMAVVLFFNGCHPHPPQPPEAPTPTLTPALPPEGQIAEGKVRVEQKVKLVKGYYKIGTNEYSQARELYINAEAAYDGWVTDLQSALVQQKKPGKLASEDNAKANSKAFIDYANKVIKKKESAQPVHALASTASLTPWDAISKLIIDAGIAIWQQHEADQLEKRKEIRAFYDTIKWSDWDVVGNPAPAASPTPSPSPSPSPTAM